MQLLLKEDNFFIYKIDNLINGVKKAGIYVLNRESALKYIKIQSQVTFILQIPSNMREKYRVK